MVKQIVILLTTFAILVTVLPAEAQEAGKVYRVGFLTSGTVQHLKPWLAAFRNGLRELGYVEGKNIVIVERYGKGRREKVPGLAAELVRLRLDVIVTHGGPVAQDADRAAKAKGRTIPIVTLTVNPVGNGLIASLARPGGNITGLTMDPGPDFYAKRLEILKEMVPTMRRIAVFWTPQVKSHLRQLREIEASARVFGVTVLPFDYRKFDTLRRGFVTAKSAGSDALFIVGSSYMGSRARQLAELALKFRLPAVYGVAKFPKAGGLMSYGTSFHDLYRRAATYVDKILKGAKPAELPFEQPSKLELVINLKTAKALGITVPPSIMIRADEVIE